VKQPTLLGDSTIAKRLLLASKVDRTKGSRPDWNGKPPNLGSLSRPTGELGAIQTEVLSNNHGIAETEINLIADERKTYNTNKSTKALKDYAYPRDQLI
jgi:hypothetical protein